MICQSKDAEQSGGYVTMVTKQGLIKRTPLEQYANIRKSGLIGIALNEGDALAWTRLTSGHDMLIVATRNGQAIRFNEEDARPMGRSGHASGPSSWPRAMKSSASASAARAARC